MKKGYALLNDPFLNKGTAFTVAERRVFGLVGLLPPQVETIEDQAKRAYVNLQNKPNVTEKRHYLMDLFGRNRTLFFYVLQQHIEKQCPIVYDPGIAESIEKYSEFFMTPQNACYLPINDMDNMEEAITTAAGRDIDLIVVTDAEAILGIGDWGTNGVSISVDKLMVYTGAAGLDPARVLPVVLDAGTNRQALLNDPLYLGLRQRRGDDDTYYAFVDKFVRIVENKFPHLYLHFEDFGREHAAVLLNKYVKEYPVFNDDIEGTGILGGLNISGESLLEQRPFARKRQEFANASELTTLEAVVETVKPTIMVGTSTVGGAFTESIVKKMASYTERTIIFPISNPTELAEATAEELIRWTDGKALVATGIPSDDVEYNGVTYAIGQANNAIIYPGLGLGVIASGAKLLTDRMISVAAHSIGGIVDPNQLGAAVLPPVTKLNHFSDMVAIAVAEEAKREGLNRRDFDDAKTLIEEHKWADAYK